MIVQIASYTSFIRSFVCNHIPYDAEFEFAITPNFEAIGAKFRS